MAVCPASDHLLLPTNHPLATAARQGAGKPFSQGSLDMGGTGTNAVFSNHLKVWEGKGSWEGITQPQADSSPS